MKLGSFIINIKHQLIILVFIALGLNVNTLFHEYAMDDIVVMTENEFVEKGIKGIPEIVTADLMNGYSTKENLLEEPRYRPFSLVVFALEYQFFGANPMVSHLINILSFAVLIALLFKLLQTYIFREQDKNLAFITCLLFVVHPIHTEVIANVKSRDELITFILLIVSLTALIKFTEKRTIWMLSAGLFCFFLALLTRESAVTFIGIVPIVLYFFYNQSLKKSILFAIPLIFVFLGYLVLRFLVVGFKNPVVTDILNAPFLFATSSEAFATKVFILFKYIRLLVFPHPLSSDYSYNQIPYIELYSIQFILSLLLMISLIAYAVYTFKKRSVLSFSILYFMITISLVSNFVVDIGTPLSERLLFQPSLAFCILLAILLLKVNDYSKVLSNIFLLVILILFSIKTVARNNDWKNNETLFDSDVLSAPNSLRTTLFTLELYNAKALIEPDKKLKNEYLKKAVYYGDRSLKIYPKFALTYLHLGFSYYYLSDWDKAAEFWILGCKLDPTNPEAKRASEVLSTVLYKQGNGLFEHGKIDDAIKCYQKSVELNNNNVEAWYNLGGNWFLINDTIQAMKAWDMVKKLDPYHSFNKEIFLN